MMLGSRRCSPCCVRCKDRQKQEFNFCPDTADYEYGPKFFTGSEQTPLGDVAESRKTITVPSNLSLPVTIVFCGAADDGFAIDGERISRFDEVPPDMTMKNRTFTMSIWNDTGPVSGKVKMCFLGANPLP